MKIGEFQVESGEGTLALRRTSAAWLRRIRLVIAGLLLVAAAVSSFMPPPIMMLITLLLGVVTVATAAVRSTEISGRGALQVVARSILVRRKETGQYREAARTELVVDDEVFDAALVTRVVVRGVPTNNQTIWNLYLVLQNRAFKVAGSAIGEQIDALAEALRKALELETPADDHAREPVSFGAVAVLVGFAVIHTAFVMLALAYPSMSARAPTAFTSAIGPLVVIVCEPTFAWVVGFGTRGLVRSHARRMLGFSGDVGERQRRG